MDSIDRIIFKKPDIESLNKTYTVVDMHFHTRYSDGLNKVEDIAKKVQELGIGIAITDHNAINGAVEINSYTDIFSIPGIEITSKEGTHILVYFYDIDSLKQFYHNDIKPHMGKDIMSSTSLVMEDIIFRARMYQTVIIFPHPYSAAYTGICNLNFTDDRLAYLFNMIDGVETINASNISKWNLKCAVLGFNLNKSITGGSDGHMLYEMGKAVSYAECGRSRKEFLDAVKNKQNKVIGKEINIIRKMASNGYKLKTSLHHYPDLFEKNIRYSYNLINIKSKALKDRVKQSIHEIRTR